MDGKDEMAMNPYVQVVGMFLVCTVLLFFGMGNPKLFHLLAELASIIIAYSIFLLAWPARRLLVNDYLLFFGFVYLVVGSVDLAHTISYKGMGILSTDNADTPTQLWIIARYIEAGALLAGPIFLRRKLPVWWALGISLTLLALSLLLVFEWGVFPTCFQEGSGLTPFKIISEYIIILLIIAAIVRLRRIRETLHPHLYHSMIVAMTVTILGELAFTLYSDVYGVYNILGHVFKIISFYYIYRALIVAGLTDPLDVLFNDLRRTNENLLREIRNRESRGERLQIINRELEAARDNVSRKLQQLQEERGRLLRKISGSALKQSDILRDKSMLLRQLSQCNEEKEIIRDQLSQYLRLVEQSRSGIGFMIDDTEENKN